MKMPVKDQVASKGMIAGWGLMALGVYVVVTQQNIAEGLSVIGLGLGVLGVRDAL